MSDTAEITIDCELQTLRSHLPAMYEKYPTHFPVDGSLRPWPPHVCVPLTCIPLSGFALWRNKTLHASPVNQGSQEHRPLTHSPPSEQSQSSEHVAPPCGSGGGGGVGGAGGEGPGGPGLGGGAGGPLLRPPDVHPGMEPCITHPFFFNKQQSCPPSTEQFLAQPAKYFSLTAQASHSGRAQQYCVH